MFNKKQRIVHHNNARPHAALSNRQQIAELDWEILMHPPYSPLLFQWYNKRQKSKLKQISAKHYFSSLSLNAKHFLKMVFTNYYLAS